MELLLSRNEQMSLGQRIKKLRITRGISQTHLARVAGVNQSLIARLESDRVIGSSHVASIAKILHVDAAWLETGHGQADLNKGSEGYFQPDLDQLTKLLASTDERGREKILTAAKDALDMHRAWQKTLPKYPRPDEISGVVNELAQEMIAKIIESERLANAGFYDRQKKNVRKDKGY